MCVRAPAPGRLDKAEAGLSGTWMRVDQPPAASRRQRAPRIRPAAPRSEPAQRTSAAQRGAAHLWRVPRQEALQVVPRGVHHPQAGRQRILEQHAAAHGPAGRGRPARRVADVHRSPLQRHTRAACADATLRRPCRPCPGRLPPWGAERRQGDHARACNCHVASGLAHLAVSSATCSPTPRKAAISSMDSSAQLRRQTVEERGSQREGRAAGGTQRVAGTRRGVCARRRQAAQHQTASGSTRKQAAQQQSEVRLAGVHAAGMG